MEEKMSGWSERTWMEGCRNWWMKPMDGTMDVMAQQYSINRNGVNGG